MQTFQLVNWEVAISNIWGYKRKSSQQYVMFGANIHSIYLDVAYLANPVIAYIGSLAKPR